MGALRVYPGVSVGGKDYPKLYSFQDAAEAILVHELLDKGVPLQVLRPVIDGLREHGATGPSSTPTSRRSPPKGRSPLPHFS